MQSNTLRFSIVMPVFNEQALIAQTTQSLLSVLESESNYEIILVDDGSSDNTWEVISQLVDAHSQVKGLRFTRNFGHQSALLAGIRAAEGKAVITMDSDGEHPPILVPSLLEKWRDGARVVQTIRAESKNLSFVKRFTSRTFYRLFSWLAGTDIRPGSADFRLMDNSVVEVMRNHPNASGFLRGFIPWTGYETEFLEFEQGQRTAGQSKFTPKKMIGLARQGILGFSIKPLRISMVLGLLTCFFALANLVYSLVMRLAFPETVVPGWTTVIGLVALLGGVQLLVIGILGEYIGVLFETIRNQPTFIISEKKGFGSS